MDDVSNSGVEEKARGFGGLIRLDNEVNENPSRGQNDRSRQERTGRVTVQLRMP